VVLGGVGFFDQFEVAIGGPSQAVAITDPDAYPDSLAT
jgi:hypothetical protein